MATMLQLYQTQNNKNFLASCKCNVIVHKYKSFEYILVLLANELFLDKFGATVFGGTLIVQWN